MPRSIQEFLIIMHLKSLHYYAFEKSFSSFILPGPLISARLETPLCLVVIHG